MDMISEHLVLNTVLAGHIHVAVLLPVLPIVKFHTIIWTIISCVFICAAARFELLD